MKKHTRNDKDREEWVNNDEELYLWWLSTRLTLHAFVVKYRAELDTHIDAYLNVKPRS
jgi:hypothetical protein